MPTKIGDKLKSINRGPKSRQTIRLQVYRNLCKVPQKCRPSFLRHRSRNQTLQQGDVELWIWRTHKLTWWQAGDGWREGAQ